MPSLRRRSSLPDDERASGEQRALFDGLWPPTLWLIGDSLEGHD